MATLGTDKQWWPTREPPTRQPDEVDMDTTRRETRRNVNLRLPFHDAQCAVVCQEGCYPDKKAHVNQDTFILETGFAGEREHVLIGVFDGHGGAGEHAAQIAAAVFLADGSIKISEAWASTAASCSTTTKRKSDPVTTMGAVKSFPCKRKAEACSKLVSPTSSTNCLG